MQWLSGLMQGSEPASDAKVKDYFVNAVHISGDNYDKMKASIIKQAASLKSRLGAHDIELDLDFEGTMKKLYAKEVAAAEAKKSVETQPIANSPAPNAVTPVPTPQN